MLSTRTSVSGTMLAPVPVPVLGDSIQYQYQHLVTYQMYFCQGFENNCTVLTVEHCNALDATKEPQTTFAVLHCTVVFRSEILKVV